LAALVAVSELAYLILRIVGAVVLGCLGVAALRSAWRCHRTGPAATEPAAAASRRAPSVRRAFAEGLVTNLANPKAAVFMVAFFPQFIPASAAVLPATLALASLQNTIELCLYLAFVAAVGRAGRALTSSRVRARLEAVTGTVLLGLGLRVALNPR